MKTQSCFSNQDFIKLPTFFVISSTGSRAGSTVVVSILGERRLPATVTSDCGLATKNRAELNHYSPK